MKLGDMVKDKITGLIGVAVSKTEYLNGCVRFGVQPLELHEGKPVDTQYFDDVQLELSVQQSPMQSRLAAVGGDRPAPKGLSNPK